jgi:hypothetical protein
MKKLSPAHIAIPFLILASLLHGCINDGWEYPFNGRNLDGWKLMNGNVKFQVIDGTIVGTITDEKNNSFLVSEKTYSDFILEADVKLVGSSNSGINFRSHSRPDYLDGKVYGYQSEIDPSDRKWSGGIYDENRRQWLYPVDLNPLAKDAFKMGEWNSYRIECFGTSIRTWVNDLPVAYVIDDMDSEGFIGLSVHYAKSTEELGRQVMWRNIRIKTRKIKPSPLNGILIVNYLPNNLSADEARQGFKLLFDGKTSTGWKSANGESFPKNGWEIKDGVLSVLDSTADTTKKGGDIVTEEKFRAFELEFEFNLDSGANSGIKYGIGNNGPSIGLEYQILDDLRHPDAKRGENGNRTLASLYDLIPAKKEARFVRQPGEWNQGIIVLSPGNKVQHWLNGRKVVEYTRGDSIFMTLVAKSKYSGFRDFGMADESPILLQDHNNTVHFRSIKIKVLK